MSEAVQNKWSPAARKAAAAARKIRAGRASKFKGTIRGDRIRKQAAAALRIERSWAKTKKGKSKISKDYLLKFLDPKNFRD